MEKLWKINCAISSMSVIDVKTGDGSLDGALAQIFMLDDLVSENSLKRGNLWDGTRCCERPIRERQFSMKGKLEAYRFSSASS